jgi:hypothetical protein
LTDDLHEAKERLRQAWHAPSRKATRNGRDVAEAKQALRNAATASGGLGIAWAERTAVQHLGEWAHQSPWQAVLTAFLTGAVVGGRNAVPLYLVARVVDIAAAEATQARNRPTKNARADMTAGAD